MTTPAPTPTPEQIQAEIARKRQSALDHIEAAQRQLEAATQELSALIGAVPHWRRAGTLSERAHDAWRRLAYTEPRGGYRLDEFGISALVKRLAVAARSAT
jgi:hypothetical protein